MSTNLIKQNKFEAPVELGVADAVVAGLAKRFDGTTADTPAGYKLVIGGLAECRTLRKQVTEAHRELKESALRWGNACDAEKRRVIALITEVEEPLKTERKRVDDEKERIKQEKLDAARREAEAKERAEREERQKAERVERERIQKEQQAESKRLAEENAKLLAKIEESKRKNREEEERLAAAQKKIDEQRAEIEREKEEAAAKALAAQELVERQKREKAEAIEQSERDKEAAQPREEQHPWDREKLRILASNIGAFGIPEVNSPWAQYIIDSVNTDLNDIRLYILRETDPEYPVEEVGHE